MRTSPSARPRSALCLVWGTVCLLQAIPTAVSSEEAALLAVPAPPVLAVKLIAHRGVRSVAPENTLAAIEAAIAMGLDYAEVDVRTTADGHLVLLHDPDVDRTTNGSGFVVDQSLEMLRQLDAGSWFDPRFAGTRIPTLDEALEVAGDRIALILDWKEASPRALLEALGRAGGCGSAMVLGSAKRVASLAALSSDVHLIEEVWKPEDVDAALRSGVRIDAISPPLGLVTRRVAELCRASGVRIFADMQGVGESCEQLEAAVGEGVDAVLTDHPRLLLDCIAQSP
ncbi:MAG: glycerophosphodiester phosphodiesterase family protein [Acidobacteria bacterium]|nr:glycerophosphodiester phosphodiesterase family protein [Acidobacteriota bacterium]